MTRPIRVAVVEDSVLFRELLTEVINSQPEFQVVIAVGTAEAARHTLETGDVDVAVIDIDLPDGNGVGLAVSFRRRKPTLGIVLLSESNLIDLYEALPKADRLGISYLLKSSSTDIQRLMLTLKSSSLGVAVVDPALYAERSLMASFPVLTKRQSQVLALVARGYANERIASELDLSSNSVVNHLTSIYRQLDIPEGSNARVTAALTFLQSQDQLAQ